MCALIKKIHRMNKFYNIRYSRSISDNIISDLTHITMNATLYGFSKKCI